MKTLPKSTSFKVDLSPKGELVIPAAVLETLGVPPGRQYRIIPIGNRLELVPILPPEEAKGFLKGINTTIEDDLPN